MDRLHGAHMSHAPPVLNLGSVSSMADEATIKQAAVRLLGAATAPARVILFGSHARGRVHADSDLDFLVIEEVVSSRVEEAARLRRAVGKIGSPVDILVYSEAHVREWGDVQNTALFEALREGRVLGQT